MSHAPLRHSDVKEAAIPYLEPDSCDEPKTEPRIRTQLLLPSDQSGVVPRARSAMTQAQRALTRLRFAPALLIGALIGSAPYLAEQRLRARATDEPRLLAQAQKHDNELETSQLAAANAPGSVASQLYAAHDPPAAVQPQATELMEAPSYIKHSRAAEGGDTLRRTDKRRGLERALLTSARRQLRSGDGLGAQLALARLSRRVPNGVLIQQRKLLEIQVWLAIGAKDKARSAAREFAKAYPQSPKLAKLSGLLLGS